jgi:hypothetical protein
MKKLVATVIFAASAFLSLTSPAFALEKVPQAATNKQTSIGTLFLLCEYDGEDLVVNWTVRTDLPNTFISIVSGTLSFGVGAIAYIGGVPEGVYVRGLPQAGGQEIVFVGPGLDPADAWVSAEADMVTVGLPPHSGTTPQVEVDCEYLN